jgi:L-aminopeptidase/D-esterase-like protein
MTLPSYHRALAAGPSNSLTDVVGLRVGHAVAIGRLTGCTVVLAGAAGAVAAVDVRGAAPGTRETELLAPENLVERAHAIVLSGGSAFGLDAASGVMRWLAENDIGFDTGYGKVPIVPAAVLFDLPVVRAEDDSTVRPTAATGYAACQSASANDIQQGNVGAGAGASLGKLFGLARAMKGGLGQASVQVGPWIVSALVACNAVGDVAGLRTEDEKSLDNTQAMMLRGEKIRRVLPGTNTSIGVISTNASLSKAQAKRLAMSGHDGLARAVRPAHTPYDGDTLFCLATCEVSEMPDVMLLNVMTAEAVGRAVVNAVSHAKGVLTVEGWLPGMGD